MEEGVITVHSLEEVGFFLLRGRASSDYWKESVRSIELLTAYCCLSLSYHLIFEFNLLEKRDEDLLHGGKNEQYFVGESVRCLIASIDWRRALKSSYKGRD